MNTFADVGRVFFVPELCFFTYLELICPNKQVVDVGAGAGFLSMLLKYQGYKVLAIDIYPHEDSYHEVVELDAEEMEFPSNALPIMCRPCHGGWPQRVIDHAFKTTKQFLYVGLPKNIDTDLDGLIGKYWMHQEMTPVGKEGEVAILIHNDTHEAKEG